MTNIEKNLKEVLNWMKEVDQLTGKPAQKIAKDNLKESMSYLLKDIETIKEKYDL